MVVVDYKTISAPGPILFYSGVTIFFLNIIHRAVLVEHSLREFVESTKFKHICMLNNIIGDSIPVYGRHNKEVIEFLMIFF